jgi:hypothetical protein
MKLDLIPESEIRRIIAERDAAMASEKWAWKNTREIDKTVAERDARIAQLEAALREGRDLLMTDESGPGSPTAALNRLNRALTASETPAEQQERALVTCKHQGTKTRDPYGTYWCDICKGILTDEYAENRGVK